MHLLFTNNLFNMRKLKQYLLCGLLCWLASCSKDDLQPPIDRATVPRSIAVFTDNNYDLSLLSAALKKTGLYDTLLNGGPFTFMAPDNAAFNVLGISSVAQIESMNTDSLRDVLKYHIIRERYFTTLFPKQLDNKFLTLSGEQVYVSVDVSSANSEDDRAITFNGSLMGRGTKRNIALANGVVHLIGRPLQYNRMTVQDYIAKDTSLSLFVAAMKQFNMWDDLKTKNTLTVFAPVNSAFLKRDLTLEKIKTMKPEDYKAVLFGVYTVMMRPTHFYTSDGYMIGQINISGGTYVKLDNVYGLAMNFSPFNVITPGVSVVKWNGVLWAPNTEGPGMVSYNNGMANVDHTCTNGIVQVIDDLFLLPELMKR